MLKSLECEVVFLRLERQVILCLSGPVSDEDLMSGVGEDSKLTKLLARQADGKDCLMGQDVQNIVRQLQLSD